MAKATRREDDESLYRAIMTLTSVEECRAFFEDLCSDTEIAAMEQRYAVASMLLDNKVYADIMEATNAGTATVSRVNRMLSRGTGALRAAAKRAKES